MAVIEETLSPGNNSGDARLQAFRARLINGEATLSEEQTVDLVCTGAELLDLLELDRPNQFPTWAGRIEGDLVIPAEVSFPNLHLARSSVLDGAFWLEGSFEYGSMFEGEITGDFYCAPNSRLGEVVLNGRFGAAVETWAESFNLSFGKSARVSGACKIGGDVEAELIVLGILENDLDLSRAKVHSFTLMDEGLIKGNLTLGGEFHQSVGVFGKVEGQIEISGDFGEDLNIIPTNEAEVGRFSPH